MKIKERARWRDWKRQFLKHVEILVQNFWNSSWRPVETFEIRRGDQWTKFLSPVCAEFTPFTVNFTGFTWKVESIFLMKERISLNDGDPLQK